MFKEMPHIRVARGADWLDRVRPGWYKVIDLEMLDMADWARCIIGQLTDGDYVGFMQHHYLDHVDQIGFGFESGHVEYDMDPEYDALKPAWVVYINERLGA